jgi:hypothetical protein
VWNISRVVEKLDALCAEGGDEVCGDEVSLSAIVSEDEVNEDLAKRPEASFSSMKADFSSFINEFSRYI